MMGVYAVGIKDTSRVYLCSYKVPIYNVRAAVMIVIRVSKWKSLLFQLILKYTCSRIHTI